MFKDFFLQRTLPFAVIFGLVAAPSLQAQDHSPDSNNDSEQSLTVRYAWQYDYQLYLPEKPINTLDPQAEGVRLLQGKAHFYNFMASYSDSDRVVECTGLLITADNEADQPALNNAITDIEVSDSDLLMNLQEARKDEKIPLSFGSCTEGSFHPGPDYQFRDTPIQFYVGDRSYTSLPTSLFTESHDVPNQKGQFSLFYNDFAGCDANAGWNPDFVNLKPDDRIKIPSLCRPGLQ